MLSAVIITHNEEQNIGRCLESIKPIADEILVVDSGSTDNTQHICDSYGVRFIHHDWEGFAGQKNFADNLALGDWILSIDADEELSDELKTSLLSMKQKGFDNTTIYSFKRLNNYCGQWIKHGGWYPDSKQRLFPRASAHWEGTVHETLIATNHMKQETLHGKLLHYTYNSFAELLDRQQHYATLAAEKIRDQGRSYSQLTVVLHPRWTFFRNYFLKLGFLDGRAGYTLARMSAYYTFIKITLCRKE